jgi:hypothetical protein
VQRSATESSQSNSHCQNQLGSKHRGTLPRWLPE